MNGVNNQFRSYFNVGMNVGLTEAQMRSLVVVLEARVGQQEADNAAAEQGYRKQNTQVSILASDPAPTIIDILIPSLTQRFFTK
ncbi:hypothetical protein [Sporomusa sp. KB1]|jgi:hypothetical protein|uniref:hypothetical protein n=1 Tax=Sporomusa sp. KB1 TaxID=943346 RepID=UPI0011A43666|nr:hypothetical protein [Sporomusa sp. KB1]